MMAVMTKCVEQKKKLCLDRGGRVSLGGELYTGPTRFVGDNVKTRQISTVQGATKVGGIL